MFFVDYPQLIPNLHFIFGIFLIATINYYVNLQKLPPKYKYIFTGICLLVLTLYPIPFFAKDRNFGAILLDITDRGVYFPFTLLYYIVIILKYYSIQTEIIKAKKAIPGIDFVLAFLFILPHYVYNYSPDAPKSNSSPESKHNHIKRFWLSIIQYFTTWLIIVLIFYYLPIPWNVIASCFRGYSAIPLVMGTGLVVIAMFIMGAAIMSTESAIYNIVGGYNFKYYQDKAFLSTSVGEFWRRWNIWGNEWFFTYMYSPLRRTFNFSHSQAALTIFLFSSFLHAYIIGLINWEFAWLTFFVFFINGLVVNLEKPVTERFAFISKCPRWIKLILTLLFLDITLGLFGLCFT